MSVEVNMSREEARFVQRLILAYNDAKQVVFHLERTLEGCGVVENGKLQTDRAVAVAKKAAAREEDRNAEV